MTTKLRRVTPDELQPEQRDAVDAHALGIADAIVRDVRTRGEPALRDYAERLDQLAPGAPLLIPHEELQRAFRELPDAQQELLVRTATRIHTFAQAQLGCMRELVCDVPGGRAGHKLVPLARAACYAPGGRFPLPSSVLMTAITARAAGVPEIYVASPRPSPLTLAAAAVAGVDALLPAGGAQAIAAFAFGAGAVPRADVIAGPGNRFVTAAKQIVSAHVRIDMLAGPSELVVLADRSADARRIAADLLAQAEHDESARPILVTTDPRLADQVDAELTRQLAGLPEPNAETARTALATGGFTVVAGDPATAIQACDQLAPEHLQVLGFDAGVTQQLRHYGALFTGTAASEVFGDYGAGPNHVLPTGGTARARGGLSVFDFTALRTWLELDDASPLAPDAAALAHLEGLEAHARAATLGRLDR